MAWQAKVGGGEAQPIEFDAVQGALRVVLNGEERLVQAREVQPNLWLLNVDGQVIEAGVTEGEGLLHVNIHGRVLDVQIADPRRLALSASAGGGVGPKVISSPMPGKVIGVLVEVGEIVEAGQGLVVVEAMKMENEYKAPQAGRVAAIGVEAGQTIEAGAKLIRLEPLES